MAYSDVFIINLCFLLYKLLTFILTDRQECERSFHKIKKQNWRRAEGKKDKGEQKALFLSITGPHSGE